MTKKLKWRLSKLPEVGELLKLIDNKIITQEEAKEILFTSEEITEGRDKKSLEEEIKFLREIVDHLSKDRKTIVETIKIVEQPYRQQGWYQPYNYWTQSGTSINLCGPTSGSQLTGDCTTNAQAGAGLTNYTSLVNGGAGSVNLLSQSMLDDIVETAFSGIKTF